MAGLGRGVELADLLGRRAERAVVEQLLAGARAGRSGALVVRGEAGIGKTALLEHARDTALASGFRVERSVLDCVEVAVAHVQLVDVDDGFSGHASIGQAAVGAAQCRDVTLRHDRAGITRVTRHHYRPDVPSTRMGRSASSSRKPPWNLAALPEHRRRRHLHGGRPTRPSRRDVDSGCSTSPSFCRCCPPSGQSWWPAGADLAAGLRPRARRHRRPGRVRAMDSR